MKTGMNLQETPKMKLNDIKTGEIFTISDTPSYPKLRTDYGYIDMRDEIKMTKEHLSWDIRLLGNEELIKESTFKITNDEVERWKKELLTL